MVADDDFQGFSKKTLKFFRDLAKNNDKQWFADNKALYQEQVQEPSREFVVDMGRLLRTIARGVHADPRVNKSLFRINRDTRFSKDKSPYKTHMGLWWWEGPGTRMECSGFYFHLEPPRLMLGVGIHCLPKQFLAPFRDSIAHKRHGPALVKAIDQVKEAGYALGGEHYKRVPRGFDPDHPRAEFLKYNGLWAALETKVPPEFYTPELADWCLPHFQAMLPIHKWLLAFTKREAAFSADAPDV